MGNTNKSKSNRIYNHSATLNSASTDEEKHGLTNNLNNNNTLKNVESKNDEEYNNEDKPKKSSRPVPVKGKKVTNKDLRKANI